MIARIKNVDSYRYHADTHGRPAQMEEDKWKEAISTSCWENEDGRGNSSISFTGIPLVFRTRALLRRRFELGLDAITIVNILVMLECPHLEFLVSIPRFVIHPTAPILIYTDTLFFIPYSLRYSMPLSHRLYGWNKFPGLRSLLKV